MFPINFERSIYIFMRKYNVFKNTNLKPVKKYENRYIENLLERLKQKK